MSNMIKLNIKAKNIFREKMLHVNCLAAEPEGSTPPICLLKTAIGYDPRTVPSTNPNLSLVLYEHLYVILIFSFLALQVSIFQNSACIPNILYSSFTPSPS
jgi:hypothetical protein